MIAERVVRVLAAPWLLALAAGSAAALAHPPFGLLPGLLGWGLLLAVIDRAEGPRPLRAAFGAGWLAAFAYFLISCWWVAEAFLVDAQNQGWMAPIAVVLLPTGLGLFWGAAAVVYRRFRPGPPILKVAAFAGIMGIAEWLRGHVLTGFPWNLPGETWAAGSPPSQGAALLGAYGMTWLTLAAAAALAAPLAFGRRRHTWAVCAGGAAAVAALYGYGLVRLAGAGAQDPAAPWVRVVQADVPQAAKYDEANFRSIVDRYTRLTASRPAGRKPDIIVWPEGAIPAPVNDYLAPGAFTLPAIAGAVEAGQTLILGGYRYKEGPDGETAYFNSLVVLKRLERAFKVTAVYDKHRLVPFGEYLPLEGLIAPLGVKKLVHVGDGFTAGPEPRPIAPEGTPALQPLICYEGLYPGFTRRGTELAGLRPRWIVNISNDAWFGRTSGPWQHLNLASYRAIEEGLPVVRATPTGVSAVIDAFGRSEPRLRLGLGVAGVIDAPLPPALAPTLFARWGDALFWAFTVLSLVSCGAYSLHARIPRPIVSIGAVRE